MHNILLPYTTLVLGTVWGPSSQHLGVFRADPARRAAHCWNLGASFPLVGKQQSPGTSHSQISVYRLMPLHKFGVCKSNNRLLLQVCIPKCMEEQEESDSSQGVKAASRLCPEVPSEWWHNCSTQPVQLSLSPVLGGSVSTVPSPAASLEKGWHEKGEEKSQRCKCQC